MTMVLEIRIRLWVAVHTLRKRYILVASPSLFLLFTYFT
jgi:hypothetical protein